VTVTESGDFTAPTIAVEELLVVSLGESLTTIGALAGGGTIEIGAGSSLYVYGASGSTGGTINFAGSGGSPVLNADNSGYNDFAASVAFVPSISGFNATDVIGYQGVATSAQYSGGIFESVRRDDSARDADHRAGLHQCLFGALRRLRHADRLCGRDA
jgi:hypothetical protein